MEKNQLQFKNILKTAIFVVAIFAFSTGNAYLSTMPGQTSVSNEELTQAIQTASASQLTGVSAGQLTQIASQEIGKLFPIINKIRQTAFGFTLPDGASAEQVQLFQQLQPLLDKVAPGIMDDIAKFQGQVNDFASLSSLANNPTLQNLQQIYDLSQNLKNFGNIQNVGDFMNAFNGLSKVIPGFSAISNQVQQGLGLINSFSQGMGSGGIQNAISKIGSMSASGGSMQNALTTVAAGGGKGYFGVLSPSQSTIKDFDSTATLMDEQAAAEAQGLIGPMDEAIEDPDAIVDDIDGAQQNNENSGQGGCGRISGGQNAGANGGQSATYLKGKATGSAVSAITSGNASGILSAATGAAGGLGSLGSLGGGLGGSVGLGGGGNGVPVIEQPGSLINLTTSIKDTNQKICEMTQVIMDKTVDLWKKERMDDVKKSEDSRTALKTEKDKNDEFMKTGRTPSNTSSAGGSSGEETKESMYPTLKKYVQEEIEAGTTWFLSMLKDSKVPDDIKETLTPAYEEAAETEKSEEAGFKARTAPTPGFDAKTFRENAATVAKNEPATYLKNLVMINDPSNNASGQMLITNAEKKVIASTFKDRAEKAWSINGITPVEKCTKEVTYNGVTACVEKEIVTPSKVVADQASAFAKTTIDMTMNADEAGEDDTSALSKGGGPSVSGSTEETSGKSQNETGAQTQPGQTTGKKSSFDFSNLLSTICKYSPNSSLCGGGSSSDNDTGGETTTEPVKEVPAISVTFDETDAEINSNGLITSTLKWSSKNADSCETSNEWVTFSDGTKATMTGITAKKEGTNIGASGTFEIVRPALFSFNAYATGGTNGTVPNSPQSPDEPTYAIEGNTLTQTITYRPNPDGLDPLDYINISLNGFGVAINAGEEDEPVLAPTISANLLSAIKGTSASSVKGIEFANYEISQEFSSLVIKRRTTNFANAATVNYGITCYNEGGSDQSEDLTLNFFE